MITTVAVGGFGDFSRLAFKVSAGQIVEQQFAIGSEQIPPSSPQMALQGFLVFNGFI